MTRLGYFVTESSEHFAEYVPWFIKRDRPDLIERFGIPLDEYPKRCVEQVARWTKQAQDYREAKTIEVKASHEYASRDRQLGLDRHAVGRSTATSPNHGLITSLPDGCAVEVPCLVDRNGIQPTHVGKLPPQLAALMRTNINVQELTVAALLEENPEHIYHAAMLDPHTAAELDLDQIWQLTDELLAAPRRLAAGMGAAEGHADGRRVDDASAGPHVIVIVGGGTAGWLTALILQESFRLRRRAPSRITVVGSSSKLGTIGVGEGSTAVFRQMLRQLGFDELRIPARDRRDDQVRHPPQGLAARRPYLRRPDRRPAPRGRAA